MKRPPFSPEDGREPITEHKKGGKGDNLPNLKGWIVYVSGCSRVVVAPLVVCFEWDMELSV